MTTMRNALRKRWVVRSAVAVLLLGFVLVVALVVALPAFVSAPDHLQVVVTRFEAPFGVGRPTIVFDRQVSGDVASRVYTQVVAGIPIPQDAPSSCPPIRQAPYYHYDLTFSRAGTQTGIATATPLATRCLCSTLSAEAERVSSG